MKKHEALLLAEQIRGMKDSTMFEVTEVAGEVESLKDFHQWTNGKPLAAAFYTEKLHEEGFYLLFIDWHRNDNYYLVVYPSNKSTTLCEIQTLVEHDGRLFLKWRYNPLKRDGKNQLRKAYFQQRNGSSIVEIPFPESPADSENFLEDLFTLCRNRRQADQSPQFFSEL